MPLEFTPATLETISTLSELANTFDQAAVALGVTPGEFADFLTQHPEARDRWSRGGIEAMNQLRICLTKQALAGSVQAFKLLNDMHVDAAPKKAAPISSAAPTSSPKKARVGAFRFCPIAEAAKECGVTDKTVQNLVKEGKAEETAGRVNPVPMEVGRSSEWRVQPGAVYAWCHERVARGISTRLPPGLKKPPGYDDALAEAPQSTGNGQQQTAPAGAIAEFDIETMKRILNDPDLPNEQKKILLLGFDKARLDAKAKRDEEKTIKVDDVIKMLRSLGEVYCATVESMASAKASDLLRVIREQFQVDLIPKNSSAQQILAAALCDQSQRMECVAMKNKVKELVEGIELLDGVA